MFKISLLFFFLFSQLFAQNADGLVNEKIFLAQTPRQLKFHNNKALIQNREGTLIQVQFNPKVSFQNLFRFPNRILLDWSGENILIGDSSKSQIEWIRSIDGAVLFQKDLNYPVLKSKSFKNGFTVLSTSSKLIAFNQKGLAWEIEKNLYPGCIWEYNQENIFLKNCLDGNFKKVDLYFGTISTLFSWPEQVDQFLTYGAGYFVHANNTLFFLNHFGKQIWQLAVDENSKFEIINSQLFYKNQNQINSLHQRENKLKETSPKLSILSAKENYVFFNPKGYIKVLDSKLDPLMDYHGGSGLIAPPQFMDSFIVVFDSLPSITVIKNPSKSLLGLNQAKVNTLYNCLLSTEIKILDKCQNTYDSLSYIEPGHPVLSLFLLKQNKEQNNKSALTTNFKKLISENEFKKQPITFALDLMTQEFELNWINQTSTIENSLIKLEALNHKDLFYFEEKDHSIHVIDSKTGEKKASSFLNIDATFQGYFQGSLWFSSKNKLLELDYHNQNFKTKPWILKFEVEGVEFINNKLWIQGTRGEVGLMKNNQVKLISKMPLAPIRSQSILEQGIFRLYDTRHFEWKPFKGQQLGLQKFNEPVKNHFINDSIIFLETKNQLLNFNPNTNTNSWKFNLEAPIYSFTPISSAEILIGLGNQKMILINAIKGTKIWEYIGSGSLLIKPQYDGNKIWIDQGKSLIALHRTTGQVVGTKEFPLEIGTPTIIHNEIILPTYHGLIFSTDRELILSGFSLKKK